MCVLTCTFPPKLYKEIGMNEKLRKVFSLLIKIFLLAQKRKKHT